MKNLLTLSLLIIYFFVSCNNPVEEYSTEAIATNQQAAIDQLNNLLKKHETPAQKLRAPTDRPSTIQGKQGTTISINPDDLTTITGQPLGADIEIELKELTRQDQLLQANAQTVADGRLLVSGGAYFIAMSSGGAQLQLKPGKKLNVQFPKIGDNEMSLFYGARNKTGQMTWTKTNEVFVMQKVNSEKSSEIDIQRKKSDIDAILDYADMDTSAMDEVEKQKLVQLEKEHYAAQKLYKTLALDRLEWINCDRFLDTKLRTDLAVKVNWHSNEQYFMVFLVFKSINSVMQSYQLANKQAIFTDVPVGYSIQLICFTTLDNKIFGYSKNLDVRKNRKVTIDLNEIDEEGFTQLLGLK